MLLRVIPCRDGQPVKRSRIAGTPKNVLTERKDATTGRAAFARKSSLGEVSAVCRRAAACCRVPIAKSGFFVFVDLTKNPDYQITHQNIFGFIGPREVIAASCSLVLFDIPNALSLRCQSE